MSADGAASRNACIRACRPGSLAGTRPGSGPAGTPAPGAGPAAGGAALWTEKKRLRSQGFRRPLCLPFPFGRILVGRQAWRRLVRHGRQRGFRHGCERDLLIGLRQSLDRLRVRLAGVPNLLDRAAFLPRRGIEGHREDAEHRQRASAGKHGQNPAVDARDPARRRPELEVGRIALRGRLAGIVGSGRRFLRHLEAGQREFGLGVGQWPDARREGLRPARAAHDRRSIRTTVCGSVPSLSSATSNRRSTT